MSAIEQVLRARDMIRDGDDAPAWEPLQWVTAIQVNLGEAAKSAMVIDGASIADLSPERADTVYRRALEAIGATVLDALDGLEGS